MGPFDYQDRMWVHPRGLLGRLGGRLMAWADGDDVAWAVERLSVRPADRVLEVGFGPGVGLGYLARAASEGAVVGLDLSPTMLAQARRRNASLHGDRLRLALGSAEALPVADDSFDRAMAVNTTHLWPDAVAGLGEVHRALRPGGLVAVAFSDHVVDAENIAAADVRSTLTRAGFEAVDIGRSEAAICLLATA